MPLFFLFFFIGLDWEGASGETLVTNFISSKPYQITGNRGKNLEKMNLLPGKIEVVTRI